MACARHLPRVFLGFRAYDDHGDRQVLGILRPLWGGRHLEIGGEKASRGPKEPTGALTLHAAGPRDNGQEVSHGDARCRVVLFCHLPPWEQPPVKTPVGANLEMTEPPSPLSTAPVGSSIAGKATPCAASLLFGGASCSAGSITSW
jgi:hypothetical protein